MPLLPAPARCSVFSFIGYTPRNFTVGSSNTIHVELSVDRKNLQEFVKTAYNISKDPRSLSSSVQRVDGADVAQTQRENFINGLARTHRGRYSDRHLRHRVFFPDHTPRRYFYRRQQPAAVRRRRRTVRQTRR